MNWLYVGGGAAMILSLVVALWPQISAAVGKVSGGRITLGPLTDADIAEINALRLKIAAIARKAQDSGFRQTMLDLVHQMEGAVVQTTEPPIAQGSAAAPAVGSDWHAIALDQAGQLAVLRNELAALRQAGTLPTITPGPSPGPQTDQSQATGNVVNAGGATGTAWGQKP